MNSSSDKSLKDDNPTWIVPREIFEDDDLIMMMINDYDNDDDDVFFPSI